MKRRDFLKTAGLLAGGATTAGWSGQLLAQSKPVTIKFDTYLPESAGPSRLQDYFLRELEARSNGTVKVRRYWAQSLNKVGEHLSAVRDGTSEMTAILTGYYQAQLPVTRGLDWYYRMRRADALQKVCRDLYQQFQPLRDEWETRYRSKILFFTNGSYAPLATREPIRSIEDLRGKRIRGYGVGNNVLQRLGAIPVPLPAPEIYTALERGVIDGAGGLDFLTAAAYKLHEIAPYFTNIGDGPHAPIATAINLRTWQSLPAPVQALCENIVGDIYAGKYLEIYDATTRQFVKTALAEGARFASLPESEVAKAQALVQPAETEAWLRDVAQPAGLDGARMQALIDAAIARYDPAGQLKTPDEIAAELA